VSFFARRRTIKLAALALIAVVVPAAAAQGVEPSVRTVSPQRWARTICTAWLEYTDVFDTALSEAFDPSRELAEGAEAGTARDQAVAAQRKVLRAATQVINTVERTPRPNVSNGAEVRANYLATVTDYQHTDVDFLEALRALPVTSPSSYSDAFASAQLANGEAWDVIGYDPLEELMAVPAIRRAIEGESECRAVRGWFDLSGLSDIEIGECWDESQLAVECNAPHAFEVFLQIEHPAGKGKPYPGDALDSYAEKQCEGEFEPYVGSDFQSSSFGFTYFPPDESGWNANDREIVCAVSTVDGSPLTEPVRGSGR
jgi:hypothetical protein